MIYYKRDDFNFEKVNFPFVDESFPSSSSYGVYILHEYVSGLNNRKQF